MRGAPCLQDELLTPGNLCRRQLTVFAQISSWFALTRLCVWGPGSTCRVTFSLSTSPASAHRAQGRGGESVLIAESYFGLNLINSQSSCPWSFSFSGASAICEEGKGTIAPGGGQRGSSNSIPSPRVFCSCGPRINMRRG